MKKTKLSLLLPCRRRPLHRVARIAFLSVLLLLKQQLTWSQTSTPFTINNNSPYADSSLYVAIVGEDPVSKNHIWLDPRTNQTHTMSTSDNTVPGPVYNGDGGPGLNGLYAACFFKLSEIANRTFTLPGIIGCRVYLSYKKPLYFYFFGATGGYSAPNKLNGSDPNQGLLYEYIELTNDAYGFFGNTSRVDGFHYPMGLELYGTGGYYKKVGDLKTKAEVLALFGQKVPSKFQGCVNDSGEIWAPAKSPDFFDGSASGTTAGLYADYFKSYVDSIWEKYKTEDLLFYAGQAGTFRGRVVGEQLQCREIAGGFNGKTGTVAYRPGTPQVFEGKGVLDTAISPATDTVDRVVQAQLTAAINRHMVNVTTPNVGLQNWYDTSKFYKATPMNYYAWFWHQPGVCIGELAYGFCYDDVADQSPSLHATPVKVVATFGGYAGMVCDSTAIVPRLSVNGGTLQSVSNATVVAGDSVQLAPEPAGGIWYWTGPAGFSSSSRVINFTNMQHAQAGTYTAVYRNACGMASRRTFTITVTGNDSSLAVNTCSGNGPAAPGTSVPDYSWQATGTANPVITFIPGTATAGSTLVILYIKTGTGSYAGYTMDASGTNFTKSITVAAGTPVSIYFTYRVGNTSTERNSGAVPHTFTVGSCGGGSNIAPTVAISLPSGATTYNAPASVTINAQAADSDGTISKVEFYNGSTKIGESTTSPYSYTWAGVAAGTYLLHAVATDNQLATATSAAVSIAVTGSTNTGGCPGSGPVAAGQSVPDYSYGIATNGNVTVTFTPGTPISGCDLAIFYYRIGTGGWMGYTMTASSTGFSASVSISGGSTIQFYFTYRRSAGGTESNSSATPHSYTVGANCVAAAARMAQRPVTNAPVSAAEIYPNPATGRLVLPSTVSQASTLTVIDVSGRVVPVKRLDDRTIDVSSLASGIYTITFTTGQQKVVKKFLKK